MSTFPWTFPVVFGYEAAGGARWPASSFTAPALPKTISATQVVSLHTARGTQLYQFVGRDLIDLSWSRESRQTSRAEITAAPTLDYGRLPDIVPWLHWCSVWDETGQELYWTGPIRRLSSSRQSMVLECRDMSALFSRTRCPMTKRWDVTDPALIAEEMVSAAIELHNLNTRPVVRADPFGDKFDYSAAADEQMLDNVLDELVQLGLHWTVVAGVPFLGPMPRTTLAGLAETDFVGDGLTLIRDGSQTFNDVLLRGGDALARARTEMGGLNLQTIVNVDSMFGVSNVDRATKQYARHVSRIHDSVRLPDNAVLDPHAPVYLNQLIPSGRFTLDAYGLLLSMELSGIDVSCTSEGSSVSVRMDVVDDDLPELIKIQSQNAISGADVG